MKKFFTGLSLLLATLSSIAQTNHLEIGLGAKYDVFSLRQPETTFKRNIDLGALAFVSFGRPINEKWQWQVGIASNNYKLNFKVKGQDGEIYSNRELVSVMRSNRLFLNMQHQTKTLTPKLSWENTFGFSLLIGAKNPYDVILVREKEIETAQGTKGVKVQIKTHGLTGSAILVGASSKLFYKLNKDLYSFVNLGFISGLGEISRVEIDYVMDSNPNYQRAIFTTNGFAPMLTFGIKYTLGENKP